MIRKPDSNLLNNEDIQDKILGWIEEKDLEILKVTKTERSN